MCGNLPSLLYHVYYIHLKKNIVIELIFPYSLAEGGGNYVPMYSNKCSEIGKPSLLQSEAEFLDVIGIKILRVFLLAIHSHLYALTDFTPPPPPSPEQKWFETVMWYKHCIQKPKSENSQDDAQKPDVRSWIRLLELFELFCAHMATHTVCKRVT